MSNSEPIRLLQIVLSLNPGGTERLVIDMTRALKPHVEARVVCLDEPGEWSTQLTDSGIRVDALHRAPGFQPLLARQIARIAKEHRASVLHCHQYSPFVYGGLAALICRDTTLVFTEHGRLSDRAATLKRQVANRLVGRFPGRLFAVSEDLRRQMLTEGFPRTRVEVIHNGIDPGAAPDRLDREKARRRLSLDPDSFIVGTVARIDPVKDLGTMMSAFCKLLSNRGDATLVIVGDGPGFEGLRSLVSDCGVDRNVLLLGRRDDVDRLLPAFDIFVNSSLTEGVSVTILEAMAKAVPVVATAVGGTPEVIVDGSTGILVPSRNPDALAEALAELGRDQRLCDEMGRAGRQRVEQEFSLDRMLGRYLDVYREG